MTSPRYLALMASMLAASLAVALPSQGRAPHLSKRFNDPMNALKGQRIGRWVGTGDSFSAGPGAGKAIVLDGESRECKRNSGGYPNQLQNTDLFQTDHGNPDFQFVSCTGDKVPDIQEHQISHINTDTEMITLSIGGNDIGFVSILTPCVYNGLGDCNAALENGRNLLYGAEVHQQWADLVRDYQLAMNWLARTGDDKKTAIYQTSYPPFFDTFTDQCDNARFIPAIGPLMTKETRKRLNLIGQELNSALATWIDEANYLFTDRIESNTPEPHRDLIRLANQDARYSGHRFCREGVDEPDLNNKDTWFFHAGSNRENDGDEGDDDDGELSIDNFATHFEIDPVTCNEEPFVDGIPQNFEELLRCVIAKNIENGNITAEEHAEDFQPILQTAPEAIAKTFHPKIAGFAENVAELQDLLVYGLPGDDSDVLKDIDFRIMAVGDELTVGFGEDLNVKSYRETLRELLEGRRTGNEGMNIVNYVGSTKQGGDDIEGHIGAGGKLEQLSLRLGEFGAIREFQPNVVLLLGGHKDLTEIANDDQAALESLAVDLEDLINTVFRECQNCMMIVSHVPPMSQEFSWPPSPELRKVVAWNALVSETVNTMRTQHGYKVMAMHPSTPTKDITDLGFPTNHGYQKIAYDFAERLFVAQKMDWISPPDEGVDDDDDDDNADAEQETNASLQIFMQDGRPGLQWMFYEGEKEVTAGCNSDAHLVFRGPTFEGHSIDDPPLPSGAYDFTIWGRECQWRGNGENTGELLCGDDRYGCSEIESETVECPDNESQQHQKVFCHLFSDGEKTEGDSCGFEHIEACSLTSELNLGPIGRRTAMPTMMTATMSAMATPTA